jgi:inhibitor of cysteine peptidase
MKKNLLIPIAFVLTVCLLAILLSHLAMKESEIKTFKDYQELEKFLKENSLPGYGYSRLTRITLGTPIEKSIDYSRTNVQVEGIDEADIVKTDGEYIYSIHGNNVIITKAYPVEEIKIVSKIEMKDIPSEIFVSEDKLIVFGQKSYGYSQMVMPEMPVFYYPKSFVKVYDITDKQNPKLEKEIIISGSYVQSRMSDGYVYVIFTQNVYYYPRMPIMLPEISVDGVTKTVQPGEIYYFGYPDSSYSFSTILSLDVNSLKHETKTFLLGDTQTVYASKKSLYVAYTKYYTIYDFYDELVEDVIMPSSPEGLRQRIAEIPQSLSKQERMIELQKAIDEYFMQRPEELEEFYNKISENYAKLEKKLAKEREKTIVYKFSLDGLSVNYIARAEVSGRLHNQFSMDEHQGKFRVATTSGFNEYQENNVYVFDESMRMISKLEGIATGESIYSARFVGDKLYLVTFKQIDPFFVIDLADEPKVLGYLKLPGVSDYIHPYDDNHLIGFGRDVDEEGRVKGIKISLFDVSDYTSPKEVYSYTFGERGSYSQASYDHKAFLFSRERHLLAVPATISDSSRFYPWQGILVFNIDLDNGISLKGKIDHGKEQFWYEQVQRSLYIDGVLYTVSNRMIKANSLDDLNELGRIEVQPTEVAIPVK